MVANLNPKRVYNNVIETIGWTPLIKLNRIVSGLKPKIYAKVEFFNPGGSVKDRIGLIMVEDAERKGLIGNGGTIIEGTSGNTGVGLAMVAAIKGYKTIFTMPDKMSKEKIRLLKAFGAEVIITPTAVPPDHPESYYSVARRLHSEIPNSIYPNQYINQMNPQAHYETTGPELWEQTDGKIDIFFCGMGTGGTISGVGKYLKEKNPKIKIVGIDPEGSMLFDYFKSGKRIKAHPYKVEGIGEDIIPETTHFQYIDDIVKVNDKESFIYARRLAREEGLLCGGSSGAAVAGMIKYIQQNELDEDKLVVVLLPDTGERYLSKFYSDEWLRENMFLEEQITLKNVVTRKKTFINTLISISPNATVKEALHLMNKYGISQLPVLEMGESIGSVLESVLLTKALENPKNLDEKISRFMDPSFPVVGDNCSIEHATALLKEHPALLVKSGNQINGIVTKFDILDYIT